MPQKFYKILLILGIIAVLATLPAYWLTYQAASGLEVDFLDVGYGDAILIKTPYGQNILIDGGPDSSVIKGLAENLAWWDKKIDLMVLTHPHDDHVTGLIEVIKRYKVKKVLYTGVSYDNPNYLAWLELIRDYRQGGLSGKIPLIIIDRPQVIKLGENCQLQIIYPRASLLGQEVDNLNNSSIVAKLVYKQVKFLLTGDIEAEIERQLVDNRVDLGANVLKVGHHGSDTSSGQEFLQEVGPEVAVIQVGANDFNLPSRRVLKRLERRGIQIFRNDLDGTVKIFSDGKTITYNP